MIYTIDNVVSKELFEDERGRLESQDYTEYAFEDKSFFVQAPSQSFLDAVCTAVCQEEKLQGIEVLLAFHRQAIGYQDCSWRIHCDSKIQDQWPHRAVVVYMSEPHEFESGTMFWTHKEHGNMFLGDDEVELARLLKEDSNDTSKWEEGKLVKHVPNRLLSYPANMFHSKYPNRFPRSREVFVMFYRLGEDNESRGRAANENCDDGSATRGDHDRALRAA